MKRFLFLWLNARNANPQVVFDSIQTALEPCVRDGRCAPPRFRGSQDTRTFEALLKSERPTILHLYCHGEREGLTIVERGEEWALRVDQLQQLFSAANIRCELLFISACSSQEVGEGLRSFANHVICFPGPVGVAHYIPRLTETFYQALAQHGEVQTALNHAISHSEQMNAGRPAPVLLTASTAHYNLWDVADPISTADQERERGMEIDATLLIGSLYKLHEFQVDALITSFMDPAKEINPWLAINKTPLGTKINDFVLWASQSNRLAEAYRRAQTYPR
jgi:hypothetical protein